MNIKELQCLLGTIPVDGEYGRKTKEAVMCFQRKYGLIVDAVVGKQTIAALSKRVEDLGAKRIDTLKKGQFIEEYTRKVGVCIHHTVSNGNISNVVASWNKDPKRIATPFVIGHLGELTECFPFWFWSHHLGLKHVNNEQLNQNLIGIEICSYGSLDYERGRFFNTYGGVIPDKEVIELPRPFKGYKYFHAYKKDSINRLGDLLLKLKDIHQWEKYTAEINFDWFNYDSTKTTAKLPWLNSHGQFRKDKNDCYPDPYLIQVLNQVL